MLKAGSRKKKGIVTRIVALIKDLYKLESAAKKEGLSSDSVLAMREEKVIPLLSEIKELCAQAALRTPPKSLLGIAVNYALKQLPYVENYLNDGRLTSDNNSEENAILLFTVGRKNWLFSGSPAGADSSAFLYVLLNQQKLQD